MNNVSKSSVNNWVRQATQMHHLTKPKTSHGKTQRITVHNLIFNYVLRFPFTTLHDVQKMLHVVKRVNLSIATIHRYVRALKLRRKKAKRIVRKSKAYEMKLQQQRQCFLDTMKQVSAKQVISIDESGIHKEMSLSHGYTCKGTRLFQKTTSQRYQNYSLVMAVSCERVVAYTILKGATNKDAFIVFLKEHLIPACSSRKYIFLLDNVRFHHSTCVKAIIEANGHAIMFTPPYSPDLNPIEHVFSTIKHRLRRRRCPCVYEMKAAIRDICDALSSFDALFNYSLIGKELCGEARQRIVFVEHSNVSRSR